MVGRGANTRESLSSVCQFPSMNGSGHISPQVLFVDDDVQVLNSLRRGLHRHRTQWEMTFEPDAELAVQRAIDSPPNVVVSDLNMPALSGIEMILEMRKTAPTNTVFILLTGAGDLQSAIAAINDARLFRFLTKPCSIDDLTKAIEEGLSWQGKEASRDALGHHDLADTALSRLSTAVVVVDRACQVAYLNGSASDLVAAKNGIAIDRTGAFRAFAPEGTQELRQLVQEAEFDDSDAIGFLSLPTASDQRDLQVVIEAISNDHVALFLADPGRVAVPPLEALQALFGLTKAEATVAHALAAGGSLEHACVAGSITMSSARTYLKRVFSKTGVSKQAELVQLLLSTPVPASRSAFKSAQYNVIC